MRLLQRSETGELSLTEDLVDDDPIPPYAILSHTWGQDNKEVTFEDMRDGTGGDKPGYEKIRFCGEQARLDGLQYFWIDTCCINKKNDAELSEAINSMFHWYRSATRCYVYLSDVPRPPSDSNDECNPRPCESDYRKNRWLTWDWTLQAINSILRWYRNATRRYVYLSDVSSPPVDTNDVYNPRSWELDFRESRWFTRGWTLQELLAPASVEFFSRERKRLGDKSSLRQQIHEITKISQSALQGDPLSQFGVDERLRWIQHRRTGREEDKAYSLLGIFNVYVLPIYGEGEASAFKRLREAIDGWEKFIRDLRANDPRDDKKRIENTKGGLLEDSYRWILENSDFQHWRNNQQSHLLWIKGDPGKGKTMLLCGIINELNKSIVKTALLSYFFCQATDSRINNATAVLRGLIYMLVCQQPSLVSHFRKYDHAGKALFEDSNAWFALSDIFTDILQDPNLNSTYLIIDALDECVAADLPKLSDFIVKESFASPRVKWIVSSRNWPIIEKRLNTATQGVRLCLELNEKSVSTAVTLFIQSKVDQLAKENEYDNKTRDAVQRHLLSTANSTFLWVALVCQELADVSGWGAEEMSKAFPPGLEPLYKRMLDQIYSSKHVELCKNILAVVSVVHRPITLDELASFVDMPAGSSGNDRVLPEIIGLCGSLLTLRERTISFVHQSAMDFLVEKAYNDIYPSGIEHVYHTIFSRSLQVMSKKLGRDVYGLGAPGFPIDQLKQSDLDPLSQASGNRLKGSERDSGYGLASRPGTASSESAFQDNHIKLQLADKLNEAKYQYDNEIQSLPSDNDDIYSQASDETTNVGMAGEALMRVFPAEEPQFRLLCEKAMARMGSQRFVWNLQRLFKLFQMNLSAEAEAEAEKAIARLLRSRGGRLRISQQIALQIQQEQDEVWHGSKIDLQITPKDENLVETRLSRFLERPVDPQGDKWGREFEDQDVDGESSTSGSGDGSEEDEFPYISELKNFLRGSRSFQEDEFPYISELKNFLRGSRSFQILLKDCMLMFLPIELKHVLLSIPKQDIRVSCEQDLSVANRVKAWVQDSESRLFWQCTCGAEIPAEQHELVTILARLGDKPQSPYWCSTKRKGM